VAHTSKCGWANKPLLPGGEKEKKKREEKEKEKTA